MRWYNPNLALALTGVSPSFPSLPGLAGRWNALNVTTSSGNVTSATDLSGGGHNLTPSGGNVPLNATGYNAKPAFDFIAANAACLSAASIAMGNGNTGYFFFVGQMKTNTANFGGAIAYGVSSGNDFNGVGGAVLERNGTSNGLDSRANGWAALQPTISLATNYRIGVALDGANVTPYINNVAQTTTSVIANFVTAGTIVVGGRYSSGAVDPTGAPWEGPITEIVVGSGSLSTTDLNNLDAYFTAQWGT
jgi:hypothetical protein